MVVGFSGNIGDQPNDHHDESADDTTISPFIAVQCLFGSGFVVASNVVSPVWPFEVPEAPAAAEPSFAPSVPDDDAVFSKIVLHLAPPSDRTGYKG
ncbi:unnamed protein product [Somion occarium]|uniref:Uncharacterized protein n=1 Tax=Somion occarium TaxID=3059160 RepID=A0ABP1EBD1_9APHY